jgi:hypothetical protein
VDARCQQAIARFDAVNARDPRGRELPYAQRLSAWVERLAPEASDALRLAARAQHLRRWEHPREAAPPGRVAYVKWRDELKQFHADATAGILREVGYDDTTIGRVQDLIRKRNFPRDPEGRVLEDALCLVFLETQLAETTAKTGEEKMVQILQRTWQKMTPRAREFALGLPMSDASRALVEKAQHG